MKGVWPMLINLMFDHSLPRKSSILHAIALIKYLLEPIANCSPNDTWEYQCSMLTMVPMAKEKTRISLFPQLKILFLSEEINQHIFDLINQMRWSFSLSVLLLWEIGLIVFQDYSMLFYKFSWLILWTGAIIQMEKCNHPSFISSSSCSPPNQGWSTQQDLQAPIMGPSPTPRWVGPISIYYHETRSLGSGLFTLSFVSSALKPCDPRPPSIKQAII